MKTKNIIIAGLAGLILAACTEDVVEKKPSMTSYSPLKIEVSDNLATTRADYSGFPSTTFETGDAIGIYAFDGSSYVTNNIRFVKQSDGSWLPDEEVPYVEDYTYYAYFPYRATTYTPSTSGAVDAVDTKFASFISDASNYFWKANQSTKANFTYSNLMIAKGTITDADDDEVTMKFTMEHKRGLAVFTGGAASATFTGNRPYLIGDTKQFLMKPETATSFTDDSGTYSLTASAGEYVTHITKTTPSYTAPTAKTPTYSGSAQALLNAGSTSDGTFMYSTDGSSWTTTVSTGTNAGNYTVYWKIVGDATHLDKDPESIAVTIAKANPTYTAPTAKPFILTSDAVLNAGSTSHGTIQYSANNSTWSTTIPTKASAGTYTVYWKLDGDTNHKNVSSKSISVTVYNKNTAEYIDFGLPSGTIWATGNIVSDGNGGYEIGAETDYGAYFSWGNVDPHFSSNGSTFDDGYNWGSSYAGSPYAGTAGASISFTSQHKGRDYTANTTNDAARACLGGSWQVPTATQFQELYDNTDNAWTSISGVVGRVFMKKTDHLSYIFFPAGGVADRTTLMYRNSQGRYWSSSLSTAEWGYHFFFSSLKVTPCSILERYYANAVRAVR